MKHIHFKRLIPWLMCLAVVFTAIILIPSNEASAAATVTKRNGVYYDENGYEIIRLGQQVSLTRTGRYSRVVSGVWTVSGAARKVSQSPTRCWFVGTRNGVATIKASIRTRKLVRDYYFLGNAIFWRNRYVYDTTNYTYRVRVIDLSISFRLPASKKIKLGSKISINSYIKANSYARKIAGVTYSSTHNGVLSYQGNGIYKAVKPGRVRISVRTKNLSRNISDYVYVTVYDPTLPAPTITKVENLSASQKITWRKVSGASKYRVFIKKNGSWVKLADTKSTSYANKKVSSGKKYAYTVRCITSNGKKFTSYYNKTGKAATYIAPPKITSFTNSSSGVTIRWGKVNGALKYRVLIKSSGTWKKLADTKSTSYLHKIKDGKKHTYTVRCLNSGNGFSSAVNTTGWSHTAPKPTVIQPTSISLDKTAMTLNVTYSDSGTTYGGRYLYETVYPSNASNKTVTWSSSNTRVATVSSYGYVKAVGNGTATVYAKTVNGKTASCKVTVTTIDNRTVQPTSISLDKSSLSLKVTYTDTGTSYEGATLWETVYPSNASNKTVTWSSSNTGVATVTNYGYVKAVGSGTATITARTVNGKTATCRVTVTTVDNRTVQPTSVYLDYSSVTLTITKSTSGTNYGYRYLNETVYPTNATNKTVTWSSSDPTVASVNSIGKVSAESAGTATITAKTVNGKTATCKVTVNYQDTRPSAVLPSALTFDTYNMTISVDETKYIWESFSPTNTTEKTLRWTSSNTDVATVNSVGLVKGVAPGTAVITAKTLNGIETKCKVTVVR